LSVRQILSFQAFKETEHPRQALLVIVVFDHRLMPGASAGTSFCRATEISISLRAMALPPMLWFFRSR
jgi:hypothetical protein